MRQISILIIGLINLTMFGQECVIYHQYEPSTSDYNVLKWNINPDSLFSLRWYIKETFDSEGRVTRLDFIENGQLTMNRLCYLPDFVIYRYPDKNTIIEELYNANNTPMNGVECEVPYKRIYTIDSNYKITGLQIDYYIDSILIKDNGLTSKSISVELDYFDKVKEQVSNGIYDEFNATLIRYYLKSYRKNNRIFPFMDDSNKDFLLEDNIEYKDAYNCILK